MTHPAAGTTCRHGGTWEPYGDDAVRCSKCGDVDSGFEPDDVEDDPVHIEGEVVAEYLMVSRSGAKVLWHCATAGIELAPVGWEIDTYRDRYKQVVDGFGALLDGSVREATDGN